MAQEKGIYVTIKEIFHKRKQNKVTESFLSLTILHSLNLVLPLITLPYVLRVVGASNYGIIVMANALLLYFDKFADYSFNITATRDVAVHRHNKKSLSAIYSKVMTVKFLIIAFSAIFYFGIVWLIPKFNMYWIIYVICFVQLIGNALFPEWFFQGMEEMKYITIINASIKIAFTICIFIFVRASQDFYFIPIFTSLGYIVGGIVAQILVTKKYGLSFSIPKVVIIKQTLKNNFNIFANQFLPSLYNNSTTFILGFLTNNATVGLYGISKNIVEYGVEIINILSRAFFPHLNRNFSAFTKFCKLILGVGFLIFIGFCAISYFIVYFLKLDHIGIPIICILAPGVFFIAMYCCYGTNYFIVKRKDKLVMKNTLIASFLGVILAFPLILLWGGIGAALNLTMARGIMGVSLWRKFVSDQKV